MKKNYDITIVGGGTAGMTADIYGYRSGKEILIIEKSVFGGQITSTSEIENYPGLSSASGYDFATQLYDQIKDMSLDRVSDEVIGLNKEVHPSAPHRETTWHIVCRNGSYTAKAVIIAVGTKNRQLGLPKEDIFLGHGLSYCATCDGAFYKNKPVAVVGGGNTALEEALYLSLLCENVYLIHRRDSLTGDMSLQQRVRDAMNITVLLNTEVIGLHGEDRLEEIETSDSKKITVSCIFVAIGQIPQNRPFADAVKLDAKGYIEAGEDCHTSARGIFAAGDCRTKKLRQLVTAASDGATAATEASNL